MEETKKKKVIRIVTFVALTIVVILAVVLTMYFVQKNDKDKKIEYITGDINQTIENGSYNFKVYDLKSYQVEEDKARLVISIEIEAKEKSL